MSVLDATKNSVNLAYLSMAMQLDMCNIMNGATGLGMHLAKPRSDGSITPGVNPSNVIGTDGVAPLSMAAAFATFASGGTYCKPIAILSVVDATGKSLPVPSAECKPGAIEPKYANTINYALSNVWKGTAKAVGAPPFPSAGKTGTTSQNEDTWFVGYTPMLATAVWVGFKEKPTPVQRMTINGTYYRNVYGSSIAAPTWKRFMMRALEGAPNPPFADPDQKLVFGEKIPVPSVVGKSESEARKILEAAGFGATIDPTQVPSKQAAGSVASQNPSGSATRGAVITLTLSNGQSPDPAPNTDPNPNPNPGNNRGGPGGGKGKP
jgi:membrane peptidoglycan carboxypeptidase